MMFYNGQIRCISVLFYLSQVCTHWHTDTLAHCLHHVTLTNLCQDHHTANT